MVVQIVVTNIVSGTFKLTSLKADYATIKNGRLTLPLVVEDDFTSKITLPLVVKEDFTSKRENMMCQVQEKNKEDLHSTW